MNKELRLLWLLLAGIVIVTSAGCRHKPAYSDIDANRTSRPQNQNSEVQAGTGPSAGAETPAEAPGHAAPSPPQTQGFKTPHFMAKGDIIDLPSYPRARRANVQIGPNQGLNVMSLVLQTTDPMDMVTAFYADVIKKNQWTVVAKTIDPEQSEWILKRDEENSARIQAKKDLRTGLMNITILRGEKLEEPKK